MSAPRRHLGYELFRALLAGLRRKPRSFDTTAVTGPDPALSLDGLDRSTAALTEALASRPYLSACAARRPDVRGMG